MYIIVVGCGKLGTKFAKDLVDDGNNVCIIDRDRDKLNSLGSGFNGRRIKGIEFDSDILIEAGVETADALIAVSSDDNINITVSLVTDKIFHVPKVIARVNEPAKKSIYNKLGIDIVNPILYEVEVLRGKLSMPRLKVISILSNNFEIIEILVKAEKVMVVSDFEKKYRCIVSGIIEDGIIRLPQKSESVQNGNKIICTVQKKDKVRLVNSICKEIIL